MTATVPTVAEKQLSYEEYLEEYRTEPPSRQPCFILDGVKIMPPAPRPIHQIIIHRLELLFGDFERSEDTIRVIPAPVDVLISRAPLRTRQPDLLLMSADRYLQSGVPDMEGPITVAPELVVEVLSPSETLRSINEKIADFQFIGVQECWLVSIEAGTVEILVLTADERRSVALYGRGQEARSLVFPDLTLSVTRVFER